MTDQIVQTQTDSGNILDSVEASFNSLTTLFGLALRANRQDEAQVLFRGLLCLHRIRAAMARQVTNGR